jgi:hypothetical protein
MVDSTSARPVVRRWSRRVASLVGRSVLAALSVVVLAYGAIQGVAVTLRAMLPLSVSVPVPVPVPGEQSVSEFVSMSVGETLTALETIPPVHLTGPVMVDPVLKTTSVLTVGVAVGFTALGCLGMAVASTPFQLSQRPSSPKELGSIGRNAVREIRAVFHRSQSEVAEDAETLFVLTGASVLTYWTASEMLLPMVADGVPKVADGGGFMLTLLLEIYVQIIPVGVLFCAIGAIVHVIWYAGLRWKVSSSAQIEGGSR